jgi:hypothetical protein
MIYSPRSLFNCSIGRKKIDKRPNVSIVAAGSEKKKIA